jgi:hypothetical protein
MGTPRGRGVTECAFPIGILAIFRAENPVCLSFRRVFEEESPDLLMRSEGIPPFGGLGLASGPHC